jgi:hypothetical protein
MRPYLKKWRKKGCVFGSSGSPEFKPQFCLKKKVCREFAAWIWSETDWQATKMAEVIGTLTGAVVFQLSSSARTVVTAGKPHISLAFGQRTYTCWGVGVHLTIVLWVTHGLCWQAVFPHQDVPVTAESSTWGFWGTWAKYCKSQFSPQSLSRENVAGPSFIGIYDLITCESLAVAFVRISS